MKTSRQIETEFGSRLARLRLSRNVTQSMLAEDAGIGVRTLRRLEAGEPSTLDTFLRIALALDLGDAILGAIPDGSNPPNRAPSRGSVPSVGAHARNQRKTGTRPGHGVTTRMTDANVILWGRRIGAVSWDETRSPWGLPIRPGFLAGAGIEVAPLTMPARETPYEFPALNRETFRGLPGMLADALPDRFGNRLIDAWLAETGTSPEAFNPVDRLCYIGRRGIGALEFEPALRKQTRAKKLEVARLVDLANRALDERRKPCRATRRRERYRPS